MARIVASAVLLLAIAAPSQAVLRQSTELKATAAQPYLPKIHPQEGRAGSQYGARRAPTTPPPANPEKLTPKRVEKAIVAGASKVVKTQANARNALVSHVKGKVQIIKDNMPQLRKRFKDLGKYLYEQGRP